MAGSTSIIADSGASGHYLAVKNIPATIWKAKNPITVKLPNGERLQNTHECLLNIPLLDPSARLARIFPGIQHSLLSLGQLCDGGCKVHLDAEIVDVIYKEKVIMTGHRNHSNKLWEVDLETTSNKNITDIQENSINNVFKISSLKSTIKYLHAACFYPAKSTWIKAIQANFFVTWPFLTAEAVRKHLEPSIISSRGRIKQTQKNIRSTKNLANRVAPSNILACHDNATISKIDDAPDQIFMEDVTSASPLPEKTNEVFIKIIRPDSKIYSDQTGAFPFPSSRGYRYIMVFYDMDSNAILAQPMKSKTSTELNAMVVKMIYKLARRGFKPKYYVLDNEMSELVKSTFRELEIIFELVPPGMHRRNIAERAIQTFKAHFMCGLTSLPKNFPIHLWDRLIRQAEATLNMLRPSKIHPQLSAYTVLEGNFNFDATPMAPPGTQVVVHEKPNNRRSWSAPGVDGWYVGPAWDHYRCHEVYIPRTRAFRFSDTVDFFPTAVALTPKKTAQQIKQHFQKLVDLYKI